ncbi:hypothetical protein Taro_022698 [Colocasia esculenta]|uniref:Uncharacterized protein n=1 Tax=Colocasia esculenta TaxID=4460 RepID=A0A843V2M1_COLES|nr:hypothetical protein [Colocasia esculenta]
MKRFPTNVTIWDAIAWSKDLRAALIKILQEPEVYEADVTELQAQALDALAAEELFTVNKDLLEAHRLSRLAEATGSGINCPERREISYEANAIGEVISRSISLPPAYMQLPFYREEHRVERLETFVVAHYGSDDLGKGEASKPIILYQGDLLPCRPFEDGSGWSKSTPITLVPVQEMDGISGRTRELCRKLGVPQMQEPARQEFFHQMWYPEQLRRQTPSCEKDTRGVCYGHEAECDAYYTVNTVGLAPLPNHCLPMGNLLPPLQSRNKGRPPSSYQMGRRVKRHLKAKGVLDVRWCSVLSVRALLRLVRKQTP